MEGERENKKDVQFNLARLAELAQMDRQRLDRWLARGIFVPARRAKKSGTPSFFDWYNLAEVFMIEYLSEYFNFSLIEVRSILLAQKNDPPGKIGAVTIILDKEQFIQKALRRINGN